MRVKRYFAPHLYLRITSLPPLIIHIQIKKASKFPESLQENKRNVILRKREPDTSPGRRNEEQYGKNDCLSKLWKRI